MTPAREVVERWEREVADRIRSVAFEQLRERYEDDRALARALGVMPSTAAALVRTSRWTMPEALMVAEILGLDVDVTVNPEARVNA